MAPLGNDNSGMPRISRPSGVLPKNINYIVLGGIALLVTGASFFSGKKAIKPEESRPTVGPSATQLKTFQQMLEKQRREAEEAKRQLEQMALANAQQEHAMGPKSVGAGGYTDPLEEKRRARAAAAPFASSFAFRAPEQEEEEPDRTSQVALHVERSPQATTEAATSKEKGPKESGSLLPAKEGNFYRLYEGTTIQSTLLNRLEGSFTGPVLCTVSHDVFSKGKEALLIPRGSQFIGEATKVQEQNQTRLAVGFKRLLMPNGYSIDLAKAPALDAGGVGLKDQVKNHHLRTFGLSGAIGLLGGLALYVSRGSPFAAGVANTTGNAGMNSLNHYLNAVPSITIREGHSVAVYLPNDLLLPKYQKERR
jgi:type IV secretion system protein TrbI